MKRTYVLLTLLILPFVIHSQNRVLPGYYVDMKGDTTFCKIKFNDWAINPETISIESGNEKRVLGVNDIKAFGIENYGQYEKARVSFHTNPIGGLNLPEEYSDEIITKEVFLKKILNGTYSLFELQTPARIYYFFREKNLDILELVYRVKQKELQISEDEQYKRTLNVLFESNNMLAENQNTLRSVRYEEGSLKKIFLIINKEKRIITSFEKNVNKRPISMDIFGGGILHQFPTKFAGKNIQNNKFDPSLSPTAGISFLYLIPIKFNRIGINLSLGLSNYKSESSSYDSNYTFVSNNFYFTTINNEQYSIKNSVMRVDLSSFYVINPLSKSKVYLKLGALYNLSLYKSRDVKVSYKSSTSGIRNGNVPFSSSAQGNETILPILSSWVSISTGLGIKSGKSKFELGYFLPTDVYSSASKENKFLIGSISICYYYSLIH